MKIACFKKILVLSILFFFSFVLISPDRIYASATPASHNCTYNPMDTNCRFIQLQSDAYNDPQGNLNQLVGHIVNAFVGAANNTIEGDNYYLSAGVEPPTYANRPSDPGLLGLVTSGMGAMYKYRPISSGDYLASINPFKPAYAAGTDLLSPVLDIWRIFRNLAYIFVVIMLVAFGFLVMLRYRIDPRTVITIADSLPRVVVALILITFSFTITGLIVDGMKVTEKLIANSLQPLKVKLDSTSGIDPGKLRFGGTAGAVTYPGEFTPWDIFEKFWGTFTLKFDLGPSSPLSLSWAAGQIARLVVNFMLISLLVQLFIALLRYFATFFILAIFGPLVFLWSILPGQEETSRKWFMQLLTGALIFPSVFLLLNIAYYLSVFLSSADGKILIGNATSPFRQSAPNIIAPTALAPNVAAENVSSFLVVGILILTSKLPEVIEEALKAAPSGRVAGAGVDFRGAAKKIPFVGGFV